LHSRRSTSRPRDNHLAGRDNDAIYCDMPVEVVFEDVTDEVSLPKFRHAGA
jgi:hypothetical protein